MKKNFCPRCKSENVEKNPTAMETATGLNPDFRCKECGYEAVAFPEKEE